MFESTRVRNRVLTPYFILPLGKADFSIEKEQVKMNSGKVVIDANKQPVMETVTVKESLNWGCLFIKRDQNIAYFVSSPDELKLVSLDNLPFLNVSNPNDSRYLDRVPFTIIDALSTFLTEQDSVINHCNLATLVKSGFISYDFQKNNVIAVLSDYCRLNSIESIDDKTLDTLISRDNAQRMGIVPSNFALHDQLKPLLLTNSENENRVDLSSDKQAITVDPIINSIDYLNTTPRVNAKDDKTNNDQPDLKSFNQGVVIPPVNSVNGKKSTATAAK